MSQHESARNARTNCGQEERPFREVGLAWGDGYRITPVDPSISRDQGVPFWTTEVGSAVTL